MSITQQSRVSHSTIEFGKGQVERAIEYHEESIQAYYKVVGKKAQEIACKEIARRNSIVMAWQKVVRVAYEGKEQYF